MVYLSFTLGKMSIVKVNVGGVIFTTTLTTLQKAKYFTELALQPDLSDVVIDRDPKAFEYLLNCLRDSRYIKHELLEEYKNEIDYFGIDCLAAKVVTPIKIVVRKDSQFTVKDVCGAFTFETKVQVIHPVEYAMDFKIDVTLQFEGYILIKRLSSCRVTPVKCGETVELRLLAREATCLDAGQVYAICTIHKAVASSEILQE